MEKKNRIILFWVLTIVGFLTHSLTDALPAFWGDSIVAAQGPAQCRTAVYHAYDVCAGTADGN